MEEAKVPSTPDELVAAVVSAARASDWAEVDRLAPLTEDMYGERTMHVLTPYTQDPNDDVRDAAMTLWSHVDLTGAVFPNSQKIHFQTAARVMREDPHECAAIWAAVTVTRYVTDKKFGPDARKALTEFKVKITLMDATEGRTDWKKTRDYVVEKTKERVPHLGDLI